jgi:hypothetical protein
MDCLRVLIVEDEALIAMWNTATACLFSLSVEG